MRENYCMCGSDQRLVSHFPLLGFRVNCPSSSSARLCFCQANCFKLSLRLCLRLSLRLLLSFLPDSPFLFLPPFASFSLLTSPSTLFLSISASLSLSSSLSPRSL